MILSAARRVLARDGAAQMTLPSVAAEADMTLEELISHFQDTQEIVTAIAADDLAALARTMGDESSSEDMGIARAAGAIKNLERRLKSGIAADDLATLTRTMRDDSSSEDTGNAGAAGAITNLEQRLQTLETAFADIVERHEKSLRERSGVVSWVEQSVNTLRQRLESSEHHQTNMLAELRTALAASSRASQPDDGVPQASEPATAAPAPPMPEFPPMAFASGSAELPPVMTDAMPAGKDHREPSAAAMESYLASARRAAKTASPSGERETRQPRSGKGNSRTRFLVASCMATMVILATAVMVLNQHVVTAMPAAAPPAPPKTVAQAAAPLSPPPQVTAIPPANPTPAQLPTTQPLDKLTEMATAGDVKAERDLGLKYLAGDGVDVNEAEAARWLMRSAYKGEPTAEYWLGTLYARGHGVPADAFQANHWYEAAAKQGNRRAMHSFAVAHFQGWGAEKDFAEAARWFKNAAELGFVDSQFNLAVLYERGAGVPQSLTDAYKWYAIAAKAGDKEADSRVAALATQLAPGDLALAQQAAVSFKPAPMNESANLTTGPADLPGG